jgi:hypothetical protein
VSGTFALPCKQMSPRRRALVTMTHLPITTCETRKLSRGVIRSSLCFLKNNLESRGHCCVDIRRWRRAYSSSLKFKFLRKKRVIAHRLHKRSHVVSEWLTLKDRHQSKCTMNCEYNFDVHIARRVGTLHLEAVHLSHWLVRISAFTSRIGRHVPSLETRE